MKAILLAATLVAVPFSAHAEVKDNCKSVGTFARKIMEGRQQNMPMSFYMDVIESGNGNKASKAYARKVIILAYEQPGFSVEENQRKSVESFGNEAELACYKAGG